MRIYVTHAEKDRDLAQQIALQLREVGGETIGVVQDLLPGDNWATLLGDALQTADWCVAIMTPGSVAASDRLRADLQFVIGDLRYRDRLIPVYVGPADSTAQIPWVFTRLETFLPLSSDAVSQAGAEIMNLIHGAAVGS